ncbi:GntR family transcriptional regulator [Palleronia sp. LCG004]|uniref:GntR family transcriptional regulator n=1 Tax=Palleronia sp. LCG004 TaxID=3079304 RepID=UPI002941C86D|nr:GntR family transcriptional regulator [Palleronia sp. LCG004]WOI55382.1 GntR family transcriptional regulator [Palleronia sp. LCG004]
MADESLPKQIAAELRRDILRGKLKPGAPIKERDTALEMGVSRTPMREAIRILAQEGLVVLRLSRSPLVADPPFDEVVDQLVVLQALEKLSAELACRNATEEDIDRIVEIADRMEREFYTADRLDSFENDMEFHKAIAVASRNHALAETHHAYLARLWRIRYLTSRRRKNRSVVLEQHAAILDALRRRDHAALDKALEDHTGHLAEDMRQVFELEET